MKPSIPNSLLVRAIAYGLLMLYLPLDLIAFKGPLWHLLDRTSTRAGWKGPELTLAERPAAVVFGSPVTMREVDQRVVLRSYRSGKPIDPSQINTGVFGELRVIALMEILAEKAIDAKLVPNPALYDEAETDRLVAEQETRAGGPEDFAAELAAAGLTRAEYRTRMRSFVGRLNWLMKQFEVSHLDKVSEEELKAWFDGLESRPILPSTLSLRHLFKPSLHRDPSELEAEIRELHRRIASGETTFEAAVAENSEDEATKRKNGNLGWVAPVQDRWPDGLVAGDLMAAPTGKVLEPMRSRLGWHIFLVDEKREARPLTLEDARPDASAHLITRKRREGLDQILASILWEGKTTISYDLLRTAPPTLGW
ncbi:MAG: peptidylprolyl isomerase [Verrucomicrobiales bacterium]